MNRTIKRIGSDGKWGRIVVTPPQEMNRKYAREGILGGAKAFEGELKGVWELALYRGYNHGGPVKKYQLHLKKFLGERV